MTNQNIQTLETIIQEALQVNIETTKLLDDLQKKFSNVLNDIKNDEELNEDISSFNLSRCKDVVKFLGISRQSLSRFREDGRFIKDVHYKEINQRLVYIPEGIIEFKKNYIKNSRKLASENLISDALLKFENKNGRAA